jgi:hypothetical protein
VHYSAYSLIEPSPVDSNSSLRRSKRRPLSFSAHAVSEDKVVPVLN